MTKETEAQAPAKAEIINFTVKMFPNEPGERVESRKYSKEKDGKKYRIDLTMPIPTTDEQAKKLYNMTLAQLIAKGVNQNSHDERVLTDVINSQVEKGEITDEFLAGLVTEAEKAHFRTARETKVSESKKATSMVDELRRLYKMPPTATIEEVYAEAAKRAKK